MSWLSGVLGAARDRDVFVDETVTPIVRSESTAAGLVVFRRCCAERWRHHRQAARQAVNSARIYVAALAEMQDTLGKLNDCATARRLLECVPNGRDAESDPRTRTPILGSIAAQERQCLVALDIGRRKWRAQTHFWELS